MDDSGAPTAARGGGIEARRPGRARVLRTIRQHTQVARVDIARETGISPATVTAITADLLSEGLIERISPDAGERPKTSRGRPREALKIRGAAHLVAGVKVSQGAITVLLVDFEGRELGTQEIPRAERRSSAAALVDQIALAVDRACHAIGLDPARVSAVGVGLAGYVDGLRGLVHWSSALTERNVPLADLLSQRVHYAVFIDNDANLVATAEHLFGRGQALRTFLVVTIQHGIGLGVVIDGQLYRGARGCGAEFGHTKVAPGDGAACQCGQRGCLEAYTSEYALLRQAEEVGAGTFTDMAALQEAAAQGDAGIADLLSAAGEYFSMGLANLINIFDPELIILAFEAAGNHPLCQPEIVEAVHSKVVQVDVAPPEIVVHNWGDRMWAKGAAAYGIERLTHLLVEDLGAP
ncbi:xylose operon repressor [Jannaschia pagri]|uniref:Xylose operon repressor n=1 Tax=Jannaschia pagri TaxID=2829797 RepID=A0ABQ4NN33_9RHOB|nr:MULTISPECIES: ROK family transcriptional regulator [unclassified Jannaschia]GIT91994.1 xylose operon repressor [Jannaschia sp. AI_61]GIT95828.1 xylose operon repressor [Jannaschia sp. AI_62]